VRRFVAAATSPSDRIGLRWTVGDGGETPGRRLQRTGIAAAAPGTAPDGPPTDSEHAECAMVPKWRFLRPVFLASRAQHISDMHSKFALGPHHGRHPTCNS